MPVGYKVDGAILHETSKLLSPLGFTLFWPPNDDCDLDYDLGHSSLASCTSQRTDFADSSSSCSRERSY